MVCCKVKNCSALEWLHYWHCFWQPWVPHFPHIRGEGSFVLSFSVKFKRLHPVGTLWFSEHYQDLPIGKHPIASHVVFSFILVGVLNQDGNFGYKEYLWTFHGALRGITGTRSGWLEVVTWLLHNGVYVVICTLPRLGLYVPYILVYKPTRV